MIGHGHVVPREDGILARCGGPSICSVCAAELAALSGSLAGDGKACLEESGEEAEQRKAANTGGEHRPGPSGGCPACIKICAMDLTVYESARYHEAWNAWHRASMIDAVPLTNVIAHWNRAQAVKAQGAYQAAVAKTLEQVAEAVAKIPHIPGMKLEWDTTVDWGADPVKLKLSNFRYKEIIYFDED